MTTKQKQSQKQVVQIFLTDKQKKKRQKRQKKKKKTAKKGGGTSPYKLGQVKPYQIPLAYPAYPQVIPKYEADKTTQIANALRNYMGVQAEAMQDVRNNLNAIRIEQQTAGKKKVAFPVEPYSGKSKVRFANEVASDIEEAKMTEDDVKSSSDASTGLSEAEKIMRRAKRTTTLSETDYESEVEPSLFPPGGGGGISLPRRSGTGFRTKQSIMADLKRQNIKFKTSMKAKQIQEIAQRAGINIER